MPSEQTPDSHRNSATAVALLGLLICAGGLLGLVVLVIPGFLQVLLVMAGFALLGGLQYVLWGWKLDRDRIQDDDPPR